MTTLEGQFDMPRHDAAGWAGDGPLNRLVKRWMDVALACAGLVLVSPLLGLCIVWVKLQDGGPAFYSQWRVGRDGWLFRIYKLRTMVCHAEDRTGAVLAKPGDARVIAGCRWMRRSHLDELPQLWNVLMGQMSLVGPRPERPEIIEELSPVLPQMTQRLCVKPGLTGLAQIRNGYTHDLAGMKRKLEFDMHYIRARSAWLDLKLLLATVPKLWDRAAH